MTAVPFVGYCAPLFSLKESYPTGIHERADLCGYTRIFNTYLTFPSPRPAQDTVNYPAPGCNYGMTLLRRLIDQSLLRHYQIATTCPLLWDVLGFPGSFDYLPEGASIY